MSVKLTVPLRDGSLRPGRVAPFAVVNLTRVRCVQAAISQASVSGPVQAGAGLQSEGPSRAGREGGQARARGEERLAFSGCLSSPPSQPFPGPSQTSGTGTQPGLVVFHAGDQSGSTAPTQEAGHTGSRPPTPLHPFPLWTLGLCDFQGEGQGCCNNPSTLTQDRHHPTEKDLPGSAAPRGL